MREFKIGDRVTCRDGVTGIVVDVIENKDWVYPIYVERSDEPGFSYSYSRKGERVIGSINTYDLLPVEQEPGFKVGDRVHCKCYGEGVILSTPTEENRKYDLGVKFDTHNAIWWYHQDGTMCGYEHSEEDTIVKVEPKAESMFKVGDRVVNKLGFQGTVTKTDRVSDYTIEVLFDDRSTEVYTPEGKYRLVANMPEELDITLVETPEIEALKARVAELEKYIDTQERKTFLIAKAIPREAPKVEAVWEPKYIGFMPVPVQVYSNTVRDSLDSYGRMIAYKEEFDPDGKGYEVYYNPRHNTWYDMEHDDLPSLGTVCFSEHGAAVLVDKLNKGLVTF